MLSHAPFAAGGPVAKPWVNSSPALSWFGGRGSPGDDEHHHDHGAIPDAAFAEHEDALESGSNDSQSTAEHLAGVGTGPGQDRSFTVSGLLGPAPRELSAFEDDGSILLANPTGLVAGSEESVVVHGVIGDGPHGSSGSGAGDYDYFLVPANQGQLITVDIEADLLGSGLDSVVGIYNSAGDLLAANDQGAVFALTSDGFLRFVAPSADTYAVVVFGTTVPATSEEFLVHLLLPWESGFASDPLDSASGPGARSEGFYELTITTSPTELRAASTDDGAIPFATPTGLSPSQFGAVSVEGLIGDGPFGSAGTSTGDFDFYRVDALEGQRITVHVATPVPFYIPTDTPPFFVYDLDPILAIYDGAGQLLASSDDNFYTYDSRVSFVAPDVGPYYVSVGSSSFPSQLLSDPFDPASGPGAVTEGPYVATIALEEAGDVDSYAVDLRAGDVVRASLNGAARRLELLRPGGELQIGSVYDAYLEPDPVTGLTPSGEVLFSTVIDTPGRYSLAVLDGAGEYELNVEIVRPALEEEPGYAHQVLFLDFDGAALNVQEIFTLPDGNPEAVLSPLSAFLGEWGLTAADEDAVIDNILQNVVAMLATDISGVSGVGSNGDFLITGQAGEFQLEILNSRDHADPFGLYPNVSRVIVGGSEIEAGSTSYGFAGIAQFLDVGNLRTDDNALALLDWVRPFGLDRVPLAEGASVIDLIGTMMGTLVAHEAGHNFGNVHVHPFNTTANVMDNLGVRWIAGPDGVFGNTDDPEPRFGRDFYHPYELYDGIEDTRNVLAFGLSTGTESGTYFDFVTGTLYVTGNIDNGHRDEMEVMSAGSDIKVYINDELVLQRPAAGVNRVVLNGSSDKDELDASHYNGPVTLLGRAGKDELAGGSASDILVGGAGDDELDGGGGRDLLIGGDGNDKLAGGNSDDLLIAGHTDFDANYAALEAILAEWTSSRDYQTRIANLSGTGSGPRDNGDYILIATGPAATVFDDNDRDELDGDSGHDWFFGRRKPKSHRDDIDQGSNEIVTDDT